MEAAGLLFYVKHEPFWMQCAGCRLKPPVTVLDRRDAACWYSLSLENGVAPFRDVLCRDSTFHVHTSTICTAVLGGTEGLSMRSSVDSRIIGLTCWPN